MVEARWYAGLYCRLIAARMRSQLQYRLSFWLDLTGSFFITFIDFLAIVILFTHVSRLAGWSLAEVAFFYGTANVSFALTDLVIGHLDTFPRLIRDGNFDLLLVRPVGTLFQLIASDLSLRRLGRVAQGLVVLAIALSRLSVSWTPARSAMLLVMTVTGVAIYSSIWILGTTIAFWTTDAREVTNAFTYGGSFVASYPINIFGGWTRRLLAFVVPVAFISYFPGLFILGRRDPLGTPGALAFVTPLIAAGLIFLSIRLWQFGVRHYRSTGS